VFHRFRKGTYDRGNEWLLILLVEGLLLGNVVAYVDLTRINFEGGVRMIPAQNLLLLQRD
jgi:hypothetical protein